MGGHVVGLADESGVIPADITSLADYECHAAACLPEATWLHIREGCERGLALAANRAALDAIRLIPRMLADIAGGSTAIELFGKRHAAPILLAPIAYQRLAHEDGELATVRAACALDTTMIASTLSSVPIEAIAAAGTEAGRELRRPAPPLWFQLYFQQDRERTAALLYRAEAAGCEVIVATVDASIKRSGFQLPPGVTAANLGDAQPQPQSTAPGENILFGTALARQAPTWADLAWLREQTRLPLVIKGILSPDDARRALDHGADGIVVSNHGGRVFDAAPAALAALPAIVEAVGGSAPLLVDGSIRSGTDVARALACGAQGVLVGRPQFHALAVAGMAGVAHMLHILRAELELALALLGCASPAELGRGHILTR
jgi:4-hydroxymandelate oxidase